MSDTKTALKSILNRNVILIFAIQFFQNISAVMGGTYVGPLGKATGLSVALIGVVGTLYTVFGMITRAPAARMTDGDKKKIALILGIGGRGVVFLLMGVFANNPTMYMILRCLQGITWSIIGVSLVSCMAMIVDRKVMGTAYAIFNAMLSIGKIFAKPIAQKMYMNHGFLAVSAVTFAAAMIAVVLIFFLDFKDPRLKPAPVRKNQNKSMNPFAGILMAALPLALVSAMAKVGYQTDNLYTSIVTVEHGLDPTAAYAVGGAISTVVGLVIGVLCDIIGAKWLSIIMLLFNGLGLVLIGRADTSTALMIAYIMYAGLGGKYDKPIDIMIMKAAPRDKQGSANATRLLCNDLVSAVATTVVGFIASGGNYEFTYLVVGAVSIVGAMTLIFFGNKFMDILSKIGEPAKAEDAAT